jgi:hypothetical protein
LRRIPVSRAKLCIRLFGLAANRDSKRSAAYALR